MDRRSRRRRRLVAFGAALALAAVACGRSKPGASATADGGGDGGAVVLHADPGSSRYALVGEEVVLDGSASTGASSFQWYFGDGRGAAGPRGTPIDRVTYAAPGRYRAVLTVFDDAGHRSAAAVTISVTYPAVDVGTRGATVAPLPAGAGAVAAVVGADANQIILIGRDAADVFAVVRRVDTCRRPRAVMAWQGFLVTGCQDDDRVGFYPLAGGAPVELALPYGSAPVGVAAFGGAAYVALSGPGTLARVLLSDSGAPTLDATFDAIADARAVAAMADGRLLVTRWRSPDFHGEVALVDPAMNKLGVITLALDHSAPFAAGTGGVPSDLADVAVSPTGREAVVPSLVANVGQGAFLVGAALTFDTTVRAALSRIDLANLQEMDDSRLALPGGRAGAAAFSSHGDYVFVTLPANRAVVRVDLLAAATDGMFVDAGFAADGALATADDRFLLVNAALSRQLMVYDLGAPIDDATPPMARVPLLAAEPLPAAVLRGAQLFNDAADPRLSAGGFLACAHCHPDGDADGRVWDFTDRGEGLRRTIALVGRAGTGDGPLNWAATADEVQDVESLIRRDFGGTGLMADADLAAGTRAQDLGDPKAGLSDDLDALAAYAASLRDEPRSPNRDADGTLSASAARGKALFESPALGCLACHAGPRLTDSAFVAPAEPRLHDVGTLASDSGKRAGGALTGLDTPTLHGLWRSARYLHDGSASTLRAVLRDRNAGDRHGATSALGDGDLADLIAYLLSLDGRTD